MKTMRIRFEDFSLDTDRRELTREGEAIRLPPKAFQLLEMLVSKHPKAVSQKDLYDALWPDTFVEETSLHNLVYQIRAAIGDSEHRIVRTVYGFGFCFAAEVISEEISPPRPRFQILVGDQEFDLREGENLVGRDWDCTVRIDLPSISRRHARMVVSPDHATIEDLGSKKGTTVDGRRVRAISKLKDGDRILFGTIAGTFKAVPSLASTETVR